LLTDGTLSDFLQSLERGAIREWNQGLSLMYGISAQNWKGLDLQKGVGGIRLAWIYRVDVKHL
jgi:hypothetical protein